MVRLLLAACLLLALVARPGPRSTLGAEPDPCEGADYIGYASAVGAVDGRLEVLVRPGEFVTVDVVFRMATRFEGAQNQIGGWAISVAHDDDVVSLEALSTKDTLLEELMPNGGLSVTEPASDGDVLGFVSSLFVTCGMWPCWLDTGREYDLVRATYGFRAPDDLGEPVDASIRYRDGLAGQARPITNGLSIDGGSEIPCMRGLTIRFVPRPPSPFSRGDANHDGTLDVSDAVSILHGLFHGEPTIHCEDAADSNDDGKLDISDAIHAFGYLFLGGPPPPSPFPYEGDDPSEDGLSCYP